MAIHDWSRVSAGIFHDFYIGWIVQLQRVLNSGILPRRYNAMLERAKPLEAELEGGDEASTGSSAYMASVDNASNMTLCETALIWARTRECRNDGSA
jgi:hypothetical protein